MKKMAEKEKGAAAKPCVAQNVTTRSENTAKTLQSYLIISKTFYKLIEW